MTPAASASIKRSQESLDRKLHQMRGRPRRCPGASFVGREICGNEEMLSGKHDQLYVARNCGLAYGGIDVSHERTAGIFRVTRHTGRCSGRRQSHGELCLFSLLSDFRWADGATEKGCCEEGDKNSSHLSIPYSWLKHQVYRFSLRCPAPRQGYRLRGVCCLAQTPHSIFLPSIGLSESVRNPFGFSDGFGKE